MERLLVANRGEIAVRVFRAAAELGISTVAVYAHEDRASVHRLKADEAYPLGQPGHPVRSYLDIDGLVELAEAVGADAVHPGYGFLSESPEFARRLEQAGITFVGPTADTMTMTSDKVRARRAAESAGVSVLRASGFVDDPDHACAQAAHLAFPLFVKATEGGGGRGLRLVRSEDELGEAVEAAQREAEGAFGHCAVFLEEAVSRPRHIEVQVLADAAGEVVHLFERDCSVQRRHQKVVELSPAPQLDARIRERVLKDAVRFVRAVGYQNAGTVEFLVDEQGRHAFIEMNPRIQVEHTVTEEVTGVDIVEAQLQLASGATLADLGLQQPAIEVTGAAIQCRITTEDPGNGFRPDLGRLSAVRETGGAGVRVDAASVEAGTDVTPYFDPLLVKITARGRDLRHAAARARRAVSEFRVRGVSTNQGFLIGVLADPAFLRGGVTTAFIDERPHLLTGSVGRDRTSRLLEYLAEVTVNRQGPLPAPIDPPAKLPAPAAADPPPGSRDELLALGAERFAGRLRDRAEVEVTDTTFRDAHQSLLATRMRTYDLVAAAPRLATNLCELFSIELWGGATFDAMVRFLHEDPWQRLTELRDAIPNICFQMLLRGDNAVGYGSYPEVVLREFITEAASAGIDVFRVFDALNNPDRMATAIDAVRETGRVAEAAICYAGGLEDPDEAVYTLDYYLGLAERLVGLGAHILAVKDMAGLLRPAAAHELVTSLRDRFDAPVHLHTHDTAGGQLATYLAAIDAGVDAVDAAAAPLAGSTSQPSLAALVAATEGMARHTPLDLGAVVEFEPYWEAVRAQYADFDIGRCAPTGRVYRHHMPGGQLSNLRQQAAALGLADRFEEVEELYRRCDELLGRIIKVTPTSKVVADLALSLASADLAPEDLADDPARVDLPESVYEFLEGRLGTPPGGWPEPFRTRALERRRSRGDVPGTAVEIPGPVGVEGLSRRRRLTRTLFPEPALELERIRDRYGDLSVLPTRLFFNGLVENEEVIVDLGPGVRLFIELEAVTDPDERGRRAVVMRVNGQSRYVDALDRSLGLPPAPVERANGQRPGHIAAPLAGVVHVLLAEGDAVGPGATVAIVEAMKMETAVSAPIGGVISRIVAPSGTNVEPGDLVAEVVPT